ncbi:16556_t:CDS:2, partial [Acaulospora colombiana]
GIEVDVWTNPPTPTLSQLPISVLFILHGRSNTRRGVEHIVKRILEVQSSSPLDRHWKRELYVDHRNHGSRLVDVKANEGWSVKDPTKHNIRHAFVILLVSLLETITLSYSLDMYAMQGSSRIPSSTLPPLTNLCAVGTAQDVSTLIDFLPSYLFPAQEKEIEQWALAGFSLGGHSTWIALKN